MTQIWNPLDAGGTYNNHPIGVWYNYSSAHWEIFNEDLAPMTPGAAFNVVLAPSLYLDGSTTSYTHVASSTPLSNYTDITNSVSDNHPNAIVLVTPNWSPWNVYDNHPVGVWYNSSTGHWSIFNEDLAAMPAHAAFNVIAISASSLNVYTLNSGSASRVGDSVYTIDGLSDVAGAYVFITPSWNPGGSYSGTYHNLDILPVPRRAGDSPLRNGGLLLQRCVHGRLSPLHVLPYLHSH